MALMVNLGEMGGDTPMLKCDDCDVVFGIFWQNNGYTKHIEYCPFCGEEVDGFVGDGVEVSE